MSTIPAFHRACLLILTGALTMTAIAAEPTAQPAVIAPTPGALPTDAEGFAFLEGRWRVFHHQMKDAFAAEPQWVDYEGRARFWTLLDGLVSVEELRTADGRPFGSAMRTFDRKRRTWSDAWVSAGTGELQLPQHGRFVDGVGTWESKEDYDGKPMIARGVWKRVPPDVVTWEQMFSFDDGKTWTTNWSMRFERIE